MAKKEATKSTAKKKVTKEKLIDYYMDTVLETEKIPKSVYKFAKDNKFEEQEFYTHFGSFDSLRKDIWNQFYHKSRDLMKKSPEVEQFSSREKLLTFYFTFFEMLTVNRSYVLFNLNQYDSPMKNIGQLRGLRKNVKSFAKDLIEDDNMDKNAKYLQRNELIFSEGAWAQTLFLIKFWMDDDSAEFEKTDIAIEKSVNTVFDVFDNTPLERVVDFGKFLWKERSA
jgi:hypothetical protein